MTRAVALLLLALPLFAQDADLAKALPVDPSITMGKLPNGMRYWIRPNKTPPGKVSLMLHVHSGSLNETEDQRGLAHFLEHMAFNGSENFGPGEMVKFFESLGMKFGQHQNAFTSFDQTTYMMHLPNTKKETLEKVFLYFGDVGWRLSLLPEEIEKERGVILDEARLRKGAGQRVMERALPILLPGSRLPDRLPIGLESVIKEAKQDRFLAYYRKWYRPENSVLIVSGDIDVETIRPMIEKTFAAWKPAEIATPNTKPGVRPIEEMRAAVITDPELNQTRVGFGGISALRPSKTVADFRRGLVDQIGTWIVNRRLRQMRQSGEAPFQGASLSTGPFLNAAESSDIDASGEPAKWQEMLTAVLLEAKKAHSHGFTKSEIELAKKTILSGAEQAAQAEPTINTTALIMALNTAVSAGRSPMSRTQRAELIKQLLPGITAEQTLQAFRNNFRFDRGMVMATMPEKDDVAVPTEAELLAVVKKTLATEVDKKADDEAKPTLLAQDPKPATPTARSLDEELGIETLTFANGARVHCRSMDFRKDSVVVSLRFVGGAFDETAETAGYTMASALALSPGTAATQKLSASQISDLMTGKKVGYAGGPEEGGVGFRLGGSPEDFEDGLRLMHVLLTEPKIEQVAFDRMKQQMGMQLPTMEKSIPFQAGKAVVELLSSNDPRLAPPTIERVDAAQLEPIQKWLDKVLATAPIEASIVGDMPREKMVELACRYIGTLPKRAMVRADLAEIRRVKQDKGPLVREVRVQTITPQAQVSMGWRGASLVERDDRRALLFASQILSSRLVKEIREDRGLTYSIACAERRGSFDGMSQFLVQFSADPGKAAEAAKIARQVVEDMREKTPPTDAEMDAVRKQIQNILDTQLKQPRFWAQNLTTMLTEGRTLDMVKAVEKKYASITKEMIAAALAKYVTDERFYMVIALPAEAKPADEK